MASIATLRYGIMERQQWQSQSHQVATEVSSATEVFKVWKTNIMGGGEAVGWNTQTFHLSGLYLFQTYGVADQMCSYKISGWPLQTGYCCSSFTGVGQGPALVAVWALVLDPRDMRVANRSLRAQFVKGISLGRAGARPWDGLPWGHIAQPCPHVAGRYRVAYTCVVSKRTASPGVTFSSCWRGWWWAFGSPDTLNLISQY